MEVKSWPARKLSPEEVDRLIMNWYKTGELGRLCFNCGRLMYWMEGRERFVCINYSCEDYLEVK